MRDLIKFALIALGGYVLVRNLMRKPGDQHPGTPPDSASLLPALDVPKTLKESARAAGYGSEPMLNIHQWNWFYERLRGVAGPAPEDVSTDPNLLMTAEEWWQRTKTWYATRNLAGVPMFARWTC